MLPKLKTLPERFVWARNRADLSQVKLAKELGISQQSIEKLENGHVTKPKYLPEAAQRLGVPYVWLLTGIEENTLKDKIDMLNSQHREHIEFMIDSYLSKQSQD